MGRCVMPQDMRGNAVYRGISPPALFVGYAPGVSEAGENETVDDLPNLGFVACEPGERSDRTGYEKKTVTVTRPECLDIACQHRRDSNGREVVIGKRGMTDVAGDQDSVVSLTRDQQLAIAEMARRQIGVYNHTIGLVTQARHLTMGEAESPVLRIIGSAVRNPVRLIRHTIKMRSQVRQRHN